MKNKAKKLFFIALVGISSLVAAETVNHQKHAEEAGCATCHFVTPETPSGSATVQVELIKSAGEWCKSCHDMEAMTLHPTGVLASNSVGLPLEEGKYMSCLTCHSPHNPPLASEPWAPLSLSTTKEGQFKTYMLNHKNDKGQLCRKCHLDDSTQSRASMHRPRAFSNREYAGSQSCKTCHTAIFNQWEKSSHAKMTRTLQEVEKTSQIPVEQLEWPREKILYVLGSHYVQRFVAQASGTLVVLPKIWDISKKEWLPIKDYGWKNRQWLKQCAGCHTTGFSSENDSFSELGVACESCHGPGLNHSRTGSKSFITSLKNLSPDRREMVCESCHTSGLDNSGQYHFPVGYKPGDDLTKFYSGLTPKPGQDPTNFSGDETYEDRRRQWDFLKSRLFLAQGLTCDYCQNFRDFSSESNSEFMSVDEYCMTCHSDKKNHPEESPEKNCISCHAPTLNSSGTMSIHDHKFYFKR